MYYGHQCGRLFFLLARRKRADSGLPVHANGGICGHICNQAAGTLGSCVPPSPKNFEKERMFSIGPKLCTHSGHSTSGESVFDSIFAHHFFRAASARHIKRASITCARCTPGAPHRSAAPFRCYLALARLRSPSPSCSLCSLAVQAIQRHRSPSGGTSCGLPRGHPPTTLPWRCAASARRLATYIGRAGLGLSLRQLKRCARSCAALP